MTAGTVAWTVALTGRPAGTVTISVSPGDASLTVSSSSLTFAPSDWNEARMVTMTAQPDDDDLADTAPLTHEASGGGSHDGVTGRLTAAVAEPATPGLRRTARRKRQPAT